MWKEIALAFLYINNKLAEKEVRKATPQVTIKYTEINVAKDTKDLFNENYKVPKKGITDDTRR